MRTALEKLKVDPRWLKGTYEQVRADFFIWKRLVEEPAKEASDMKTKAERG